MTEFHPVLAELNRRTRGKSGSGVKLALAIEGGGMRAVITSGMCAALESYGASPTFFDNVYGSSAGSVIAAFFVAEQIRMGTPVFYEDITTRRFIDFRRAIQRRPIMDLDFLVRDVIVNSKPLDYDRVITSRKLRIIATDLKRARRAVLGPPETFSELANMLQASATIPLIADSPHVVDGTPYVDASVSEAIPWQTAIDEDATHVLVLSSRALGLIRSKGIVNSLSERLWTRGHDINVKRLVASRVETSQRRAAVLQEMTTSPAEGPPYVYAICPALEAPVPSQLEQNSEVLIRACELGFSATAQALGKPLPLHFITSGYFDRVQHPGTNSDSS